MGMREQPEGEAIVPPPEKYDKLGDGGGRLGPRDHIPPSQYAQAKQEDDSAGSECSDNEDGNLVSDSIIV